VQNDEDSEHPNTDRYRARDAESWWELLVGPAPGSSTQRGPRCERSLECQYREETDRGRNRRCSSSKHLVRYRAVGWSGEAVASHPVMEVGEVSFGQVHA
jgi:hypothetical protein